MRLNIPNNLLNDKRNTERDAPMISEDELYTAYEAYTAAENPHSRYNQLRVLRRFLAYLKPHGIHPYDVSTSTLGKYLEDLKQAYKPNSIHQHISRLKNFYRYLYEEQLDYSTHPDLLFTRAFTRTLPRKPEPEPKVFSEEEWTKMWAACPREKAAFLYLLYYAGPRIQAYLNCQIQDFDARQGTLTITETKNQVKNVIALNNLGKQILEEHIRNFRGQPSHDFLFVSRKGSQWAKRSAQGWLYRFTKKVCGKHYHPRSFRASLITHMFDRGATEEEIRALTKHHPKTLKHYKLISLKTQRKILKAKHPLVQKEALQEEMQQTQEDIMKIIAARFKRLEEQMK